MVTSKSSLCQVFGHTCKPKAEPLPTNNNEAWKLIGEKLGGGGDALDAVTRVVSHTQFAENHSVEVRDESEAEDKGDIPNLEQVVKTSHMHSTTVHKRTTALGNPPKDVQGKTNSDVPQEFSSSAATVDVPKVSLGSKLEVGTKHSLDPDPKPPNSAAGGKGSAEVTGEYSRSSNKKKGRKQSKGNSTALPFSDKH